MKHFWKVATVALCLCGPTLPVVAEPQLPSGLQDEPDLPDFNSGAGSAGVIDSSWDRFSESESGQDESPVDGLALTGFWELRAGARLRSPVDQRHTSLAETRLALSLDSDWQGWHSKVTGNAVFDDLADSQHVDLETGDGWFDLREAWVSRRLGEVADLKAGRQVLTWGVGDLLFINDLFPKDWNSFLLGRDEQYLKAPSDAVRVGVYSDAANLNLVYTPRFDSDRYITGDRLSYYSASAGAVVGEHDAIAVSKPDRSGTDDELAVRLYRAIDSIEVALYGYQGFWKSPAGFDPHRQRAAFPELRVVGASLRGPVGMGIFSAEVGYYDSRDDRRGTDPFVNNSEWRGLLGYEWELAKNTTLAVQYYAEQLQDYQHYRASLFPGQWARDELRQLATVRVTRQMLNQNLILSVFGFYSPTDDDAYLRPSISYKASDAWLLSAGLNLFSGRQPESFFGQFESNSNGYVALRYSF